MIVGNDLRKLRLSAGKTTLEMALAAGVKTRKTYENWERDASSPTINQFIRMVTYCGYRPGRLIDLFLSRTARDEYVDLKLAGLNQEAENTVDTPPNQLN